MAKTVFGAPVGWYDATPLGRIFNRFSSDVITLDKDLMNDISSYSDMVNRQSLCLLPYYKHRCTGYCNLRSVPYRIINTLVQDFVI